MCSYLAVGTANAFTLWGSLTFVVCTVVLVLQSSACDCSPRPALQLSSRVFLKPTASPFLWHHPEKRPALASLTARLLLLFLYLVLHLVLALLPTIA